MIVSRRMKKKEKPARIKQSSGPSAVAVLVLVALCFVVYANTLAGNFVWDDQVQLVRNTNVRTLSKIPQAFTTSLWSFMYSRDPGADNRVFDRYYRPLQTVIYMIVYQLAGLSPSAYHFANIIFHCAASVLVYLLCLELGLEPLWALLAAALFAVHPVHTEAIAWIAGVGDLACAIFYLGALIAFLRHRKYGDKKWLWISVISFLVALFAKEMAATLPLVLFILSIGQKEDRQPIDKALIQIAPYALAVAVYAGFRIAATGLNLPSSVDANASFVDWITLAVWIVGLYFRYAIAPYPLYIYHLAPLHFADRVISTLLYALLLLGTAAIILIWRQRLYKQGLWLSIFAVSLIPVLYFKAISGGVFFAERYLYIPSIAFAVLSGFVLSKLNRNSAIVAACALAAIFSFLTIQRNRDWHDEQSLYARTLQFQPEATTIWTSLGEAYLQEGKDPQAEECFRSALKHVDDARFVQSSSYESYRIYHGLGLAAARQAKPTEAVADLRKAMEIYPQGDAAYTTLGGVFVSQRWNNSDAVALLEKAIQLNPVNDLARDYLGVALMNAGQPDRAIQSFRDALQINPQLASAKQHLDIALRLRRN
jgi:tetratricopeptide (TPR) repeat protein